MTRHRYAADVEAAFTGRPQKFGTYDEQAETATDAQKGDGTEMSGYVSPDMGPFSCSTCVHFQSGRNEEEKGGGEENAGLPRKSCDHPIVVADPEVKGEVDAAGCCNYWKKNTESRVMSDRDAGNTL
jgi:hypothetical protein